MYHLRSFDDALKDLHKIISDIQNVPLEYFLQAYRRRIALYLELKSFELAKTYLDQLKVFLESTSQQRSLTDREKPLVQKIRLFLIEAEEMIRVVFAKEKYHNKKAADDVFAGIKNLYEKRTWPNFSVKGKKQEKTSLDYESYLSAVDTVLDLLRAWPKDPSYLILAAKLLLLENNVSAHDFLCRIPDDSSFVPDRELLEARINIYLGRTYDALENCKETVGLIDGAISAALLHLLLRDYDAALSELNLCPKPDPLRPQDDRQLLAHAIKACVFKRQADKQANKVYSDFYATYSSKLTTKAQKLSPVALAERCMALLLLGDPGYMKDYEILSMGCTLETLPWGSLLYHFVAEAVTTILIESSTDSLRRSVNASEHQKIIKFCFRSAPFLPENLILQARLLSFEIQRAENPADQKSIAMNARQLVAEARGLNANVAIPKDLASNEKIFGGDPIRAGAPNSPLLKHVRKGQKGAENMGLHVPCPFYNDEQVVFSNQARLGEGSNGVVKLADLNGTPVAVKLITTSPHENQEDEHEAKKLL